MNTSVPTPSKLFKTAASAGKIMMLVFGFLSVFANYVQAQSAPIAPASGITTSAITSTTATINWTGGVGSAQDIFVNADPLAALPPIAQGAISTRYTLDVSAAEGQYSTASSEVGSSGWYCISSGNTSGNGGGAAGPEVISGLTPGTSYQVIVVIYNTSGVGGGQKFNYLLPVSGNPVTFTTAALTLSSLVPSSGTLSPAFDPGTQTYSLNEVAGTTSINLTPTVTDPTSTVTVNSAPATSGQPIAVTLIPGANPVQVVVTGSDGVTTNTYNVNVGVGNTDATLSALGLSAGTLSPAFLSATTSYSAGNVTNATSTITVTPTTNDPNATVTVNGGSASTPVALTVGFNSIPVVVTAQDGETIETYTVTVTRQSNDASLQNLVLTVGSSGVPIPGFTAPAGTANGTVTYNVNLPFTDAGTNITLTPTSTDPNALIFVNAAGVTSGTASGNILLSLGNNPVNIKVTSQDGSVNDFFTINVNVQSNVATLATFSTNAVNPISPAFTAGAGVSNGNLNYSVTVPPNTPSITVTASSTDPNTTESMAFNGGSSQVVGNDGSFPPTFNLTAGINTIVTTVVSQDGTVTDTYTLTVNEQSTVASLSNLTLSNGGAVALSPAFSTGTLTGYMASLPYSVSPSVTVTPTSNALGTITVTLTNANIPTGTPQPVASGSPLSLTGLVVGANTITVTVLATDNVTTQSYVVTATVATPAAIATLNNLTSSGGAFNEGAFTQATTAYTQTVLYSTPSVTLTPTLTDPNATVTVNGAPASTPVPVSFAASPVLINVVVTAQDGHTTQTYTVTVTVPPVSTDALLTNLVSDAGAFNEGAFSQSTTTYSQNVPNATTDVTLTPTVENQFATVLVNGVPATNSVDLAVGLNVIPVVVTAQDGSTTQTYTVNVTRAGSAVNTLSALVLSSGALNTPFVPGTTSYTQTVSSATASVTVTPVVSDPTATVTVNGTAVASGATSGSITLTAGSATTITVVVTPQSGTTNTYTVTVTRPNSSNAALQSLATSTGTLVQAGTSTTGFAAGIANYTLTSSSTSVTLTPTVVTGSGATVVEKVNNATVTTGSSFTVSTSALTTVTFTVTAQDQVTTDTYNVLVTETEFSGRISALTVNTATLSPTFTSSTQFYTASVSNATASVTVRPTTTSTTTVSINGVSVGTVSSGSTSPTLNLNVGLNTITLVNSSGTWTVWITRQSAVNALSNMVLSAGTLSPAFSPSIFAYTATIPLGLSPITVTPTTTDGTGTIKVNGGTAFNSGVPSQNVTLTAGSNTVSTVVTSQGGTAGTPYVVTVTAPSNVATLANLVPSTGSISPAFASATTAYTETVSGSVTSIALTPTVTAGSGATVQVNGATVASGSQSAPITLNAGPNVITTAVTSQDGSTLMAYTLTVTQQSNTASLANLSLTGATLSPSFSNAVSAYTTSVTSGTTSLTLTATSNLGGTITVALNGGTASGVTSGIAKTVTGLQSGANTVAIVVTSSDGTQTKTYNIVVTRAETLVYNPTSYSFFTGVAASINAPTASGSGTPTSTPQSYTASLPPGLIFNTTTGAVTGTPTTVAASLPFVVTANYTGGITASATINIGVAAPTLNYAGSPLTYFVGSAIATLSPTSNVTGAAPGGYTVSPALPGGLALDPVAGGITGNPTTATAQATYTVTATYTNGVTATFPLILTVQGTPSLAYSGTSPYTFYNGTGITSLTPSGNDTPTSYAVSPNLATATGLTFSTTTGIISGTPNRTTAAANYIITATYGPGVTVPVTLNIATLAAPTVSYTPASVTYYVGVAASSTPTSNDPVTGGYTINTPLSAGLSIDAVAGTISGTPTATAASTVYTVTATYSLGATKTANITILVTNPSFTYTNLSPSLPAGTTVSLTPTSVLGTPQSYSAASLPAGLSINTSTGVISGFPTTVAASAPYVIQANYLNGVTSTATLNITVTQPTIAYSASSFTFPATVAVTSFLPTQVSGTPTSFTGTLPPNMTLNAITGAIAGTPTTVTASTPYTITANYAGGITASAILNITISAPSTDATLSGVTIANVSQGGSVALGQTFAPGTTFYTANAASGTTSIRITPTANNAGYKSITVNGATVVSGAQSGTIALPSGGGLTTVTIIVTAQDGVTTATYTVNVGSTNTSTREELSALTISAGNLSPGFDGVNNDVYTDVVLFSVPSVTVTPTFARTGSTITVAINGTGQTVASGSSSTALPLNTGLNTILISVNGNQGTTGTYTIYVTKPAVSTDASLSALTTNPATTLSPAITAGTFSYSTSVSNAASSITVTPTLTSGFGTYTVAGQASTPSGTASQPISLPVVGPNVLTIGTVAQDGSTTGSYTLTVNRQSNIGTLSSLTATAGSLNPSFPSGATTSGYTIIAPSGTLSTTITPTATDPTSTITVNGATVASGQPSGSINLNTGSNTITVAVTSQDLSVVNTYTLTVIVQSSIASLASLTTTPAATLSPTFAPGTFSYNISVPFATSSITLTPTSVAAGSIQMTANNASTGVNSGTASVPVTLAVGQNTITLLVTSTDFVNNATYTITVTRGVASPISTLASLTTTPATTFAPSFDPGTNSYTTTVSATTSSLTLTPTTTDGTGSIAVNGGTAFSSGTASQPIAITPGGTTPINVVVTSQDTHSTSTYTLTVTRPAPSTDATLSALSVSAGTLNPAFVAGNSIFSYVINGAGSTTTVTPTATAGSAATITVNGTLVASGATTAPIALTASGVTTITIVVTAQDNTTTNSYTVNVGTAPQTTLSGLVLTNVTAGSSNVTLTPGFATNTGAYTANIPYSATATSLSVTPSATTFGVTIKVNGSTATSGTAIPFSLNAGSSTNFSIVASSAFGGTAGTYNLVVTESAQPVITATGTPVALNTTVGTASAPTSFNVSGANIAGNVAVTAPPGFEVSATSGGTYSSSFNITTAGTGTVPVTLSSTPVFVRLAATDAVNSYSGNVTLSSTGGATNVNVAIPSSIVSLITQTITFNPLAPVIFTTPDFSPGATSTNILIPVTYLSDNPLVATIVANKIHITGVGTANITASQLGDATHSAATPVIQQLTVNQAAQTITFNPLSPTTFGNTPITLTATSDSGLPISYSSDNSAVATVSGNTLTIVGAGSANITASQAGSANFLAATSIIQPLTVGQEAQTITFTLSPTATFGDAPITLNGVASSGLTVAYASDNTAVATVSGGVLTIVGPGTANITASQAGNTNFSAAANVPQQITVGQEGQSITFTLSPTATFGDAPITLNGVASSGLPVTYASDNTAVATVSGGLLTIVAPGIANITASQAGNAGFSAAANVPQQITVGQAAQTITFTLSPTATFGDSPITLNGVASSGLAITYASDNTAVATVSGGVLTIIAPGIANITASQAGNADFLAAADVPQQITVGQEGQSIAFTLSPTATFGDGPITLNATATSGLPVTFSSDNPAVATVSGNTLTIVGGGTANITASQAGNADFAAATAVIAPFTVNTESQTINFTPILPATFGGPPIPLIASASSGLPVTFSSDNPAVATISGSILTIVGAGSANITASQAGNTNFAAATPVILPLTVSTESQTINFGPIPPATFGDAPIPLSATASSGLPVTFSSDNPAVATISGNILTIVGAGSANITASQAGNTNFAAATPVLVPFTVSTENQTISFAPLAPATFGDVPITLNAMASSGLPVTFSSDNLAVATVSGNILTIVGAGPVTITASQAGNTNFAAATPVGDPFIVNQEIQDISFAPLAAATFGDAPITLNAMASSGLPVTYSSDNTNVATVSGNTLTIVGAGSANITASQAGNANVFAATPVIVPFTVNAEGQSIAFTLSPTATFGDAPITLNATATSGLPVTYSSDNTNVATISGNTLTIVGPGVANITASQAGNTNFSAAADVPQQLTVGAEGQTIAFTLSPTATFGDAPITLNATATSGLPVTYASDNTAVATISGNTLTIVGAGVANITASQAGNTNFSAAADVPQQLTVGQEGQSIAFTLSPTATFGDSPITLNATATSGLPVTYSSDNTNVATISGNTLTIVGGGVANITASQAGNTNFSAAADVPQQLTVGAEGQTIAFTLSPTATFGDAPITLNATATSGLPVTYASDNTAVATISGNTLTIVGAGVANITASQAGNASFSAAADVPQQLTVGAEAQSITFTLSPTATFGDSPITLNGVASSGLPVTYASDNTAVATISGNTLTIVGAGVANITASQAGNTNFSAAADVPQQLTVGQEAQSIAFTLSPTATFGDAPITLNATATSGLPVTYSSDNTNVATISGNTLTIVGAGVANITASQAGNTNFSAAADVPQQLTVGAQGQTIAFTLSPTATFGDAPITLNATATSGLPVTYASDNTAVATISGNTLTIVGAGVANITASQAGNTNFSAAADVPQQLTVGQEGQSITFTLSPTATFGDSPITLNGVASSGLTVTYASDNTAVATVSGGVLTIVGPGTANITASQAGNTNFSAAADVPQQLTVGQEGQSITFTLSPTATFGDAPITLNGVASSGLTVTYASDNTAVATVSGGVLTIVGPGTANITASQAGNADFSAAADVPQQLTVGQEGQSIAFTLSPTATFGDAPITLNATATSGLPVSYSSDNTSVATISGNTLTIVGGGVANITASQAGNADFSAAANVPQQLTVGQEAQSIAFTLNPIATVGDAPITLNATATSGLPVSYSSDNTAVATVSGSILTIVGAGPANITASQVGNTNFAAATSVIQPLTVKTATDATLSSLVISSGALTPGFTSVNTSYTQSVPFATSSVTLTPTTNDARASFTVTLNGTAVNPASIALAVGANTINTIVLAQDGVTTETYSIVVNRAPSSNALLSHISISSGTLTPVSGTPNYTVNVGNAITSVTVTPTASDPTAIITVNGTTVASGAASAGIPLSIGANTINILVKAQDGVTSQPYVITVTRAQSSNAMLSHISISSGTLTPVSGTPNYTVNVTNATASVTVTPTTADPTATVTVNGTLVASGTASTAIPLTVGANTITLVGIAQDGTNQTYLITVTRAKSSNDALSHLSISAGTITPVAGTPNYSANVSNAVTSTTVTATVADPTASVTVNGTAVTSGVPSGSLPLVVGPNVLTVVVSAQDGVTNQTYLIVVTRAASSNANLASLSLSSGGLTPAFATGTTSYTASVGNTTTSVTVTPAIADPTATVAVSLNGATAVSVTSGSPTASLSLNVGANTIATIVTAQDGVTTKTYTVTVTRAPSNVAYLSNMVLSSGTLSPSFASMTPTYTASVGNAVTGITVTPTTLDPTATVKVNGTLVTSGSASATIPLTVGANTITTTVMAQDGITTITYTLTVTRAKSSNALLSHISISSGTLTPVAGTPNYTDNVTNATASVTVTPTTADPTATVTVNGTLVTSGTASAAIPLVVGTNTITLVGKAQDGSTNQTYVITVTRAKSSIATLSHISISSGTLTPVTGTPNYTVNVTNATTSVTVTPTTTDPNATVTVNGNAVSSGVASAAIPLSVGANVITIKVTAQDGSTSQIYLITVTRPSTNALLSSLSLSSGTLSPAFAGATTTYTASVANTVTSVTVTPTKADPAATIKVNGTVVTSGTASTAITLNVGANSITTVVTAQDGVTTKTYTVTVTRAKSSIATLSHISISSGTLTPVTGTPNYTVSVTNATTSVTITPTTTDPTATVTVNGSAVASGVASAAIPLSVGANVIPIKVTAQDGSTTQTYVITVTRAKSSIATLSHISISSGTLTPVTGTPNYTVSVVNTVTSVTVTPTTTDPTATVTVNTVAVTSGVASAAIPLSVGANTITIVVTAQDGTTQQYVITVTRAKSTNDALSHLSISAGTLTGVTGTPNYTASIGNATTSVTVTPTTTDPTATVTVAANGSAAATVVSGTPSASLPMVVGTNVINIIVTAQDGVTNQTYTIVVTRATGVLKSLHQPAQPENISVTKPTDTVAIENDGVVVHQGVSPNGDGINDFLTIDGISAYPNNTFSVIDRNGALVYQVKGYDNNSRMFDGHSNINGRMQQPGTYFYSLDYVVNGQTKHKTGFIILKY